MHDRPSAAFDTSRNLALAGAIGLLGLVLACAPALSGDGGASTAAEGRVKAPAWNGVEAFTKPPAKELRAQLSPLQYEVTQLDGTERAFQNEFWKSKEVGLYVDLVSGEPLFASVHKYDSGTGWPSFWRPVDEELVVTHIDTSYGMRRTEVRSKVGDSHLGHIFRDGPEPTGLRYCINSASLDFVPLGEMAARGYGAYLGLFEEE